MLWSASPVLFNGQGQSAFPSKGCNETVPVRATDSSGATRFGQLRCNGFELDVFCATPRKRGQRLRRKACKQEPVGGGELSSPPSDVFTPSNDAGGDHVSGLPCRPDTGKSCTAL